MTQTGIDKQLLRLRLKDIRAAIDPDTRKTKSRQIADHLLSLLEDYSTVLAYVSKPPEVETWHLIAMLLKQQKKIIVPIIQRADCSLRLSYLTSLKDLTVSTFNVPEPIGHEIPADGRLIEAAVIPLIGFDLQGHRLGYGAGYYDRFLQRHPGVVKIGTGFSCQQVEYVPHDRFDIGMNYIVTEKGVIECNPTQKNSFPGT